MIYEALENLIEYGIEKKLISKSDKTYVMNQFLEILKLDTYIEQTKSSNMNLEETLSVILDDAIKRSVIEDSILYRDLLDTKLMGVMTPFPSTVESTFETLYNKNPKNATDWYYDFSQNTDYIRRYRINKDVKWKTDTKYGKLDITINLSKPEKDPKAIAAAKAVKSTGYPKCLLCKENVGSSGSATMPARQNHRIIPLSIGGKSWFLQYSPYVYYNEHCILFSGEHEPMKIDRNTFSKMLDFIDAYPHYFVGSNADLPIVGGSILSHDHFQGGGYQFAMDSAKTMHSYSIDSYRGIKVETLKWPLSVIRLTGENREQMIDLSSKILDHWRQYTNKEANIHAYTKDEPHNTITPIARSINNQYQIDLVLRNNITTDEHPLGVYHPHSHLHHIKKENIGLIEVLGLAVLPSRLKDELEQVEQCLLDHSDATKNDMIKKHNDWIDKIRSKYTDINQDNVKQIVQDEVGIVFLEVLECAGVFKENEPYFDQYINEFIHSLEK